MNAVNNAVSNPLNLSPSPSVHSLKYSSCENLGNVKEKQSSFKFTGKKNFQIKEKSRIKNKKILFFVVVKLTLPCKKYFKGEKNMLILLYRVKYKTVKFYLFFSIF